MPVALPLLWSDLQAVDGLLYVSPLVDPGGDGSILAPFNSIGTAFAAVAALAIPGLTVLCAKGTYSESLIWPDVEGTSLEGIAGETIIDAPAGDTLTWAPGAGLAFDRMAVRNLTLRNSNAGGRCLVLDGDATAVGTITRFGRVAFTFDGVPLDKSGAGDAASFRSVGVIEVRACTMLQGPGTVVAGWTGNTTIHNCGYVAFRGAILGLLGGASLDYAYDDAVGPMPTGGRQGVFLLDSTACNGSVTLRNTPLFVLDPTSVIYGAVLGVGLSTFLGPNHAPIVILAGTVGTAALAAATTLPLPAITAGFASVPFVDLSGGTFWGAVTISSTALGPARNYVRGQLARFNAAVSVGADTDLDIRTAFYTQALLGGVGNGALDRSQVGYAAGVIAALGTPKTIIPPLPPVGAFYPAGAPYVVLSEATTPVAIGITAKLAGGFTATSPAGQTAALLLQRMP